MHLPVSNVDVTPTLLALGFDHDSTLPRLDGRAITEAFVDGPDEQQIPLQTKTYVTAKQDRRYRAAIQMREVEGQRYIDKSWRIR